MNRVHTRHAFARSLARPQRQCGLWPSSPPLCVIRHGAEPTAVTARLSSATSCERVGEDKVGEDKFDGWHVDVAS